MFSIIWTNRCNLQLSPGPSCQSGVWTRQSVCPSWAGDLNWLEGSPGTTSCINGSGLGNAPTSDWFFVEVIRHVNAANYYETQRATGMTGAAAGITWVRSQQSASAGGGWSGWTQLGGANISAVSISLYGSQTVGCYSFCSLSTSHSQWAQVYSIGTCGSGKQTWYFYSQQYSGYNESVNCF